MVFLLFFIAACENSPIEETGINKIAVFRGEGKKAKLSRLISNPDSIKRIVKLLNTAERNPRQFSTNRRPELYYTDRRKTKSVLFSGAWIKYNKKSYQLTSSLSALLEEN